MASNVTEEQRSEEKMGVAKFRAEVEGGKRFEFGKNWKGFLTTFNKQAIEQAEVVLENRTIC